MIFGFSSVSDTVQSRQGEVFLALKYEMLMPTATTVTHVGHAQTNDDTDSAREVGHAGALCPFEIHTTFSVLRWVFFASALVTSTQPSLTRTYARCLRDKIAEAMQFLHSREPPVGACSDNTCCCQENESGWNVHPVSLFTGDSPRFEAAQCFARRLPTDQTGGN